MFGQAVTSQVVPFKSSELLRSALCPPPPSFHSLFARVHCIHSNPLPRPWLDFVALRGRDFVSCWFWSRVLCTGCSECCVSSVQIRFQIDFKSIRSDFPPVHRPPSLSHLFHCFIVSMFRFIHVLLDSLSTRAHMCACVQPYLPLLPPHPCSGTPIYAVIT